MTVPPQLLVSATEQFTFGPPVDVTAGGTTGQGAGASQTREQDTGRLRRTPKGPKGLGLRQMGVGMGRRVTSSLSWLLARPGLSMQAQGEVAQAA